MGLGCNRKRNAELPGGYAAEDLDFWYVVLPARGKAELAVQDLRRRGLRVFQPTMMESRAKGTAARMHGRRAGTLHRAAIRRQRVEVEVAMFPGYLFVRASTLDDLAEIYAARGVDNVLCGASDQPVPVPWRAMFLIRQKHRAPRKEVEAMFKKGEAVRVIEGPMMSFVGVVDQLDGEGRVRILIDILGAIRPVSIASENLAQQ